MITVTQKSRTQRSTVGIWLKSEKLNVMIEKIIGNMVLSLMVNKLIGITQKYIPMPEWWIFLIFQNLRKSEQWIFN